MNQSNQIRSKKNADALAGQALLDIVQKQTLKYFWDFAHPVSGMARERSNVVSEYDYDLNCVTTGGTGFGIMGMIAATSRGWLTRQETLERVARIIGFLETAEKYHGILPHFLDGNTGKAIPFSRKDDGADIVETSFLMMGLLSAREYFSANTQEETALRERINALWKDADWNWHTRGGEKDLYWHWSPNHQWDMNLPVRGWNECLVTHVLAASSPTHPVSPDIYQQGWAGQPDFKNGRKHGTIKLTLGPPEGGPLFFAHYSFMGINPRGLKDQYADYWQQNRNHVLINRAHCIENPHQHKGYGSDCWGLTASDDHKGYSAHSPTNDNGAISPTAALSSFPYTPKYAMQALRHFYEDMGDKIWGKYGFIDAFNESEGWYADSHLAIDQGAIVVMIENYRSGLLWDLFMNCPEVKQGLQKLGFESPYISPSPKRPRSVTGGSPKRDNKPEI